MGREMGREMGRKRKRKKKRERKRKRKRKRKRERERERERDREEKINKYIEVKLLTIVFIFEFVGRELKGVGGSWKEIRINYYRYT